MNHWVQIKKLSICKEIAIVPVWNIILIFVFITHYSEIHPALQQIPAHSTLELCLCWLALDRDIVSHVGAS